MEHAARDTANKFTRSSVPRVKEKEKETCPELGLCMNCDERDKCTFPKPEGGVWHCEEYK